jgi:hypothetical protein
VPLERPALSPAFHSRGDGKSEKPSQFLRHLRILWTSRLPTNVQVILAGMPEVGLDAAALCADRIIETVSPSTVASISPGPDYAELVQTVRNLSCQVSSLVAKRSRHNYREHRSSFRDRRPRFNNRRHSNSRGSSAGGSPTRDDTNGTWCWYHRRFTDWAQRCSLPCTFSSQGN